MAKTPQELIAETQAEYAADKAAEAAKAEEHSGFKKGVEAFGSSALDTFSGGGASWLESVTRNWALPDDKQVTPEDVRREWKELHDARSGLAAAGKFAGHAGQYTAAGKVIGGAAKLAQLAKAAPLVARGGKAVETAMNAPGILGGAGSGAITGGVLGTGKEAARLATTDQEFNPIQSAANIGLEAGLGGLGGGVGGAAAAVLPKGVIAALEKAPIDPRTIGRVQSAVDAPIVRALGKTTAEGKPTVHEAIRLADEPTLATLASKLAGLKQSVAKDNTGTLLAEEAAGQAARTSRKMGTIQGMATRAEKAEKAAAKSTSKMEKDTMKPEAYWKVQDDPALKLLRDTVTAEERAATATGYQTRKAMPMTPTAAKAAAVKAHPADIVAAVTRTKPRANAEELSGIRSALEAHSPYFKALHDAQTAKDLGGRILGGSLGRGHATPPPQGSPTWGASFAGGPKVWARDAVLAGRDALQGAARRGAVKREMNMTPEEFLKIVGKRTGTQKNIERLLPSFLIAAGNNMLN